MWLNLAASRSDDDMRQMAVNVRDDIAAKMTPAQIAEAQRMASEWTERRLTSQPRDLTVCQFRLRGSRFSGNVVALLTSRAALLPCAAQGAFCE
jgi:hypothetical protein